MSAAIKIYIAIFILIISGYGYYYCEVNKVFDIVYISETEYINYNEHIYYLGEGVFMILIATVLLQLSRTRNDKIAATFFLACAWLGVAALLTNNHMHKWTIIELLMTPMLYISARKKWLKG